MIKLNNDSIDLSHFQDVVFNFVHLEIDKNLLHTIKVQREKFESFIEKGTFYGINTGFGENASIKVDSQAIDRIQKNIVVSHSASVGEFLDPYIVRGMIFLRLKSLLNPNSCVRPELINALKDLLNSGVVPCVSKFGSVGASGDLAPLSEIGALISGNYHKKEVFIFENNRWNKIPFDRISHKISTIDLKAKEGLALINGTQATTSISIFNLLRIRNLLDISDLALSMTIEALKSKTSPFDRRLLSLKKHKGPVQIGEHVLSLLKGSKRINKSDVIQDPYSIRCYPQVAGAVLDNILWAEKILLDEANSLSDNPVMIDGEILSGGNFHAESAGFAMELLNMGIVEIGNISERRIFLMLNPAKNKIFSPFLAEVPGEMNGMMIAQYTAASLANYNKTLAMPSIVDTISTSADQEDHVSMAYNSALRGQQIIENVEYILSIEILTALQAIKFFKGEGLSPVMSELFSSLDKDIPFYRDDIQLNILIERVKEKIGRENFKKLIPSLWKK